MENTETKKIRFVNGSYKTLFVIDDGEEIEIVLYDGTTIRRVCRYIDDCHLWVGNGVYHIHQFAEIMERANQTCRPASRQEDQHA
jgi:hypothetical protein